MKKIMIVGGILATLTGAAWWFYDMKGVVAVGLLVAVGFFLWIRAKVRGRKKAEAQAEAQPAPQGGGVQFTAKVQGMGEGRVFDAETLAELREWMEKMPESVQGRLAAENATVLLARNLAEHGVDPGQFLTEEKEGSGGWKPTPLPAEPAIGLHSMRRKK